MIGRNRELEMEEIARLQSRWTLVIWSKNLTRVCLVQFFMNRMGEKLRSETPITWLTSRRILDHSAGGEIRPSFAQLLDESFEL